MSRTAIVVRHALMAMIAAGLFGVVHDQISYTVSAEYYTLFKFRQFHLLDVDAPVRLKVAAVGWMASWWMGLPLALLSAWSARAAPTPELFARWLQQSVPLMMGVALLAALIGLWFGYWQTATLDLSRYRGWYLPAGVQDMRHFLCVGYMHNAAYAGGVLAVRLVYWRHRRLVSRCR